MAPDSIAIRPRAALDAVVHVPGSKSITNRALLVAALAESRGDDFEAALVKSRPVTRTAERIFDA